jgi:hypothetical protein
MNQLIPRRVVVGKLHVETAAAEKLDHKADERHGIGVDFEASCVARQVPYLIVDRVEAVHDRTRHTARQARRQATGPRRTRLDPCPVSVAHE